MSSGVFHLSTGYGLCFSTPRVYSIWCQRSHRPFSNYSSPYIVLVLVKVMYACGHCCPNAPPRGTSSTCRGAHAHSRGFGASSHSGWIAHALPSPILCGVPVWEPLGVTRHLPVWEAAGSGPRLGAELPVWEAAPGGCFWMFACVRTWLSPSP